MAKQVRTNTSKLRVLKSGDEVVLHPSRMVVSAQTAVDEIRHEEFDGRDHLVVPVIALVEGVLHPSNAPFQELALASEFGKHPQGWNGRPIVLNHPIRNNEPVSANSPSVLEDEMFGMMFNTKIEDKKLKTEAWFDTERVASMNETVQETVQNIENGETTEVSVGIFVSLEVLKGTFEEEEFGAIWREVVPDHLAILPEGVIGACSVEDGCGTPRINAAHISSVFRAEQIPEECPCKGACGATGKCDLPECPCNLRDNEGKKGVFQQLTRHVMELIGLSLSDVDTRSALQAALAKEVDDFTWIVSVNADEGTFVYEQGWEGKLLRRSFAVNGDEFTIGDDVENVRSVTTFVPTSEQTPETEPETETAHEEITMNRAERVAALIALSSNQYTDDHKKFLTELPDDQFDTLEACTQPPETEEVTPELSPEPAPVIAAAPETPTPKVLSAEEYIGQAPAEIQTVLNEGLRLQKERRGALIQGIKATSRNTFTDDALEAMETNALESIATLANVPDYSGLGSPRVASEDDDNAVPKPKLVFDSGKKAQGE